MAIRFMLLLLSAVLAGMALAVAWIWRRSPKKHHIIPMTIGVVLLMIRGAWRFMFDDDGIFWVFVLIVAIGCLGYGLLWLIVHGIREDRLSDGIEEHRITDEDDG